MCGQFSRVQIEQINHAVSDCNIMRFTIGETVDYIKSHLQIDLSYETVKNYKRRQRDSAQQWITNLAKSRRADYIAQYRERIEEIEKVQNELWNIINKPQTPSATQVKAAEALMHCTVHLIEIYDAMPLVKAMKDYTDGLEPRSRSGPITSSSSSTNNDDNDDDNDGQGIHIPGR